MNFEETAKTYIEKLMEYYAEKYKWKIKVEYNCTDFSIPECGEIEINKRHKPSIMLCLILHEIGHILLSRNSDYNKRYSCALTAPKRSVRYKVSYTELEFAAWQAGLEFATIHSFKLDPRTFNKVKTRYMKKYLNWAVGKTTEKINND